MRDVKPLMVEIKGLTSGVRYLMIFIKAVMKIIHKRKADIHP